MKSDGDLIDYLLLTTHAQRGSGPESASAFARPQHQLVAYALDTRCILIDYIKSLSLTPSILLSGP